MGEIPKLELQSWYPKRGKFLQQNSDSEWKKSHIGVLWMPEGEFVLPPPSGDSRPNVLVIGTDKKWVEVGMLPSNRLDASTPNWGLK